MFRSFLFLTAFLFTCSAFCEESYSAKLKEYLKLCIGDSEYSTNSPDPNMEGSLFKWRFESEYDVVYANKKLFSFSASEHSYTGGAHGSNRVTVGSLLRGSGKRVTLKDIAPTEQERKELLRAITLQTAKRYKCSLKELPGKLQHMPFLTENFYFSKDGIVVVYNEYSVACFADSPLKILVPYSELKKLKKLKNYGF